MSLTLNWHDRSLAPERLWGEVYRDLIRDLKSRGAWFATAGEATSWFRKRRAAEFESDSMEPQTTRAKVAADQSDNLPGLRLRVHSARKSGSIGARYCPDYVDTALDETDSTRVGSVAHR